MSKFLNENLTKKDVEIKTILDSIELKFKKNTDYNYLGIILIIYINYCYFEFINRL